MLKTQNFENIIFRRDFLSKILGFRRKKQIFNENYPHFPVFNLHLSVDKNSFKQKKNKSFPQLKKH
jgi:hypothetical protein